MATRRNVLAGAAGALFAGPATRALADDSVDLHLPGGNGVRALTDAFPQKGRMILQRTHPALLETPFEVFDRGVLTPNDQFFVRWHWGVIPDTVDAAAFRLAVRGHVTQPLSLSLDELLSMPRTEVVAVNQCSGNSRGLFQPRIAGGQWGNGAMGNARWTGVRLRDVLDRAGVRAGAVAVRFDGLDEPVVPDGPDFRKSLAVDHARDGEVMLAFLMNGEPLPLLNGFPLRVIVPGWYSTYWVKMLSDIEVLDAPDDSFWMKTAYRIPDTPNADVKPGQTGFATVPISRMNPRSFVTNLVQGATAKPGSPVRGVAMGGDCGVARVDVSGNGTDWQAATLGADEGPYSFRTWQSSLPTTPGPARLLVRCTNTKGAVQPVQPVWNAGGYMQNRIETLDLVVAT